MRLSPAQQQAFWNKVDKSGGEDACWIWLAARNRDGYGNAFYGGTTQQAHRLVLELLDIEIPKNMLVCHHCDNPPCCNPKHLFIGTHLLNSTDRDIKKRNNAAKGEQNGSAKLTEEQVREIRHLYATTGISQRDLAIRFNVSVYPINQILTNRNWKHIS